MSNIPANIIGISVNQNQAGEWYPFESPLTGVSSGIAANLDIIASGFDSPLWIYQFDYGDTPRLIIRDDNGFELDTDDLPVGPGESNEISPIETFWWHNGDNDIQVIYSQYKGASSGSYTDDGSKVKIAPRCYNNPIVCVRFVGANNQLVEYSAAKVLEFDTKDTNLTYEVSGHTLTISGPSRIPVNSPNYVRYIKNVEGDSRRNVFVQSSRCINVSRNAVVDGDTIDYGKDITLEHQCEPCCDCNDYAYEMTRLRGYADRLNALIQQMYEYRSRFDEAFAVLSEKAALKCDKYVDFRFIWTKYYAPGRVDCELRVYNPTKEDMLDKQVQIAFDVPLKLIGYSTSDPQMNDGELDIAADAAPNLILMVPVGKKVENEYILETGQTYSYRFSLKFATTNECDTLTIMSAVSSDWFSPVLEREVEVPCH